MTAASLGALTITSVAYGDAAALVAELDDDLLARYGGGDPVQAHAEQFTAAVGGRFLLARASGADAGCAGLRRIAPGRAELKRMWVRPGWRGRGIARALLAACESAARDLGHHQLWLETGSAQPEAVTLYTSAGYTPVERFGQYAGEPDSIYLGRDLEALLDASRSGAGAPSQP